MRNDIEIHQVLHGYREGHELVASTLNLSSEQRWQMLVLSDLSGSPMQKGFETYLTGYPLSNGGYYCLARTWYAPELSRPGSVWTHSLVFSDSDLARIPDFRWLLRLFMRPKSFKDLDAFNTPLRLSPERFGPYQFDKAVCKLLLHSLYGESKPVFLVSNHSIEYEELVIALFSQQWPRLRRNFRFCTGSLGADELATDIAVIPPEHKIRDSAAKTVISEVAKDFHALDIANKRWLEEASIDVVEGNDKSSFRQFLWQFGPDYEAGREHFRALAEIFIRISSGPHAARLTLEACSNFFPDEHSSERLKGALFGRGQLYSGLLGGEVVLLQILTANPHSSCIPESVAAIKTRANALSRSDIQTALQIGEMLLGVKGKNRDLYLDALAGALKAEPEAVLLHSLPLIIELVHRNPQLLGSEHFWQMSSPDQSALIDSIATLRIPAEVIGPIVSRILQAGNWQALRTLVIPFGQDCVATILRWIDSTLEYSDNLPREVFEILKQHTNEIIKAVDNDSLGARSLKIATLILDPRAPSIRRVGPKPWLKLVEGIRNRELELNNSLSSAFLLTLGLTLPGDSSDQLVMVSFADVYEAARTNRLTETAWHYLEPHLPWYLVTWDRCIRLLRGTVSALMQRKSTPQAFVDTFKSAEHFDRALQELWSNRNGRKFLKKLCKQRNSGELVIPDSQLRLLNERCRLLMPG